MNNEDIRHLDLLSLLHYIMGGITAFFSLFFLIHVFIGIMMITGKLDNTDTPSEFGWFFVVLGATLIIMGWCIGAFMVVAGQKLKKRTHRVFCIVVAAIECIITPLGTVLGVFTIITLNKDSVKAIFIK